MGSEMCIRDRHCSDPVSVCNITTSKTISENRTPAQKKALNFYDTIEELDAFAKIYFCLNMSMCQCLPVEILHQWFLGVTTVVIKFLLDYLTPFSIQALDKGCMNTAKKH